MYLNYQQIKAPSSSPQVLLELETSGLMQNRRAPECHTVNHASPGDKGADPRLRAPFLPRLAAGEGGRGPRSVSRAPRWSCVH